MHLHLGELLLSVAFFAAALIVLVGVFRSNEIGSRHDTRIHRPPVKRIAKKSDDDENDRKAA